MLRQNEAKEAVYATVTVNTVTVNTVTVNPAVNLLTKGACGDNEAS